MRFILNINLQIDIKWQINITEFKRRKIYPSTKSESESLSNKEEDSNLVVLANISKEQLKSWAKRTKLLSREFQKPLKQLSSLLN